MELRRARPHAAEAAAWTLAIQLEEIARLVEDPVDVVGLTAIGALALLDE